MRSLSLYLLPVLVMLLVWLCIEVLIDHRPKRVVPVYLVSALGLWVGAFLVFRVFVRRQYLRRGRLGPLSTFLQLLIWALLFSFPYLYNPPNWAWFWTHEAGTGTALRVIALVLIALGLVMVVAAMSGLGLDPSLGLEANKLRDTGLYRLTRNPQVVGCTPAIIGLVLLWPSWYALGWLALFAAVAHLMVRTEEEHLGNIFGEKYEQYCAHVPRYLKLPGDVRRSS